MTRAVAPYFFVALVLSGAAGGVYGAGLIGVPALYGAILIAGLITLVGYVRWDERRHA